MKPEVLNSRTSSSKQSLAQQRRSTLLLQQEMNKKENELGCIFDSVLQKLSVDHGIIETDYSHEFKANKVDPQLLNSPYIVIKNENDKLLAEGKGAYKFLGGDEQDLTEQKTLNKLQLPGVNERQDMPKEA